MNQSLDDLLPRLNLTLPGACAPTSGREVLSTPAVPQAHDVDVARWLLLEAISVPKVGGSRRAREPSTFESVN